MLPTLSSTSHPCIEGNSLRAVGKGAVAGAALGLATQAATSRFEHWRQHKALEMHHDMALNAAVNGMGQPSSPQASEGLWDAAISLIPRWSPIRPSATDVHPILDRQYLVLLDEYRRLAALEREWLGTASVAGEGGLDTQANVNDATTTTATTTTKATP